VSPTFEASAPAKINLGLRILSRRPDGYHEIESVFAPLDLEDRLVLRVVEAAEPGVSLALPAGGAPADEANLAVRAARAFLTESGLALEIGIELEKHIPLGAGLGGGSSDAGAVLRTLAGARPGAVDAARLRELALALGADVPYFLDPQPARVAGIGERVSPLAGVPAICLLLVNPGVALPTREVYRAYDALVPDSGPRDATSGSETLARAGAPDLPLDNDLEPVAIRLCPALRRLREQLAALSPLAVSMSGSGGTLYGVYPSREAAERARQRAGFPAEVWSRVAATLESR
jgi:4-diphosphocytidyl-2-C-methyl-D-erythritol kinase